MFDLSAEFLEELGDLMEDLGFAVWVHDEILGDHVENARECWFMAQRILILPVTVGEA